MSSPVADNDRRRSRGRPPKTEAEVDLVRTRVLAATRTVFADVGYHGLSVELVLHEAGVSRPTFYKYFRSLDEVVERLLAEVNQDLVARLLSALASASEPFAKVEAAVLAWRQWGEDLGAFLRPFFAELHDRTSPVGRHRERTLELLMAPIAEDYALTARGLVSLPELRKGLQAVHGKVPMETLKTIETTILMAGTAISAIAGLIAAILGVK